MSSKFRSYAVIVFAATFLGVTSLNSWAIVNGTRDCEYNQLHTPGMNCSHPEVGSMVWFIREDAGVRFCSNRLISKYADKAVVLTAAHCAAAIYPERDIGVNFDSQVVDDSYSPYRAGVILTERMVMADRVILHPYNQSSNTVTVDPIGNAQGYTVSDFALIVIEDPLKLAQLNELWNLPDGQLANLLPVDYLDSLSTEEFKALPVWDSGLGHDWKDYGDPSGWHNIGLFNGSGFRMNAELTLTGLSRERILTQQIQMKDQQGICYGDSGSSAFMLDEETQAVTLVAMPTWVNDGGSKCHATVQWVRLDRPNALDFLGCAFVDGGADEVQACVDYMFFE